jgi:hypothetical protein
MADVLGTNYGEKYGRNSLKLYFQTAISPKITNKKWSGDIRGGRGDRVNILTYGLNAWDDYTGADITFHDVDEIEGTLILEKQRNNSFRIKDWDRFKSYATDIESTELSNVADLLKQEVDSYNLGFYTEAGGRVSEGINAGTVQVISDTGQVEGVGTAFTTAAVGDPVTIQDVPGVYQIVSIGDDTHMDIADMDDVTRYSGGTSPSALSYNIENDVPIPVDKDTIDDAILSAKEKLDRKSVNGDSCPKKDRFLVIPSAVESILLKSNQLTPYTPSAYEDVTKLGIIGMYRGFKVFVSEEVHGDKTSGFHCLAGHSMGITHAFVQIASENVRLENNFGKGLKQLIAYGSKVLEARKKCLCDVFVTTA